MEMARIQRENDTENAPTDDDSEAEQTKRLNPPPRGDVEEMELKKIPVKTTDGGFPEIIGRPKRCCKVEHLRYSVFGLNLILAILGFAIIVLSIWVRVDPDFWEYNTTLQMNDFYRACYMFMAAGLVIMIVAFFGCCGAINEVQWMLFIYLIVSCLFFIIEIVAVILIWHAPFNKTIRTTLEGILKDKVDQRESDESTRFFIDYVQAHLQCCGSIGPRDYYSAAPSSCQDPRSGIVFERGCTSVMFKYLETKAGIVGGIALPILLFHLISLAATFCVLLDIRAESRYSI